MKIINGEVHSVREILEVKGAQQATLNATSFDGQNYTVCTVTYFQFKPSANMTTVTIEPHATEVTVPTKSPEELQHEAEISGWFPPPRNEFSWFYPWYRLHFVFEPCGIMDFDEGISPLPFADTSVYTDALMGRVMSFLPRTVFSVLSAVSLAETLALIVSQCGPVGFLGALIISTNTKLITLATQWDSVEGLMSAYIASLMATLVGLWKNGINIIVDFVQLIARIKSISDFGFGRLYGMFSFAANVGYQTIILSRLVQLGVPLH